MTLAHKELKEHEVLPGLKEQKATQDLPDHKDQLAQQVTQAHKAYKVYKEHKDRLEHEDLPVYKAHEGPPVLQEPELSSRVV